MHLSLLKTKIHRATVTHSELNYEGSIAIDDNLLAATGIREFEQVRSLAAGRGAQVQCEHVAIDRARSAQRLFQVLDQVAGILDAHRQSDQIVGDLQ